MLIILAVILGIAWLMGFTVFHVASGAIHLLVVLAIAAVVFHFVRGRGTSSV
ncbi:MAG: lmo0937 family membrane protein [Deltaproteobacteria bacterium]|nr:lmo0937 family membrane protein [Deltaproteobacteria bacterium]